MSHTYYVYILSSRSRTLYTGVTNNLARRLVEHRDGKIPGFTSRYRIFRLVHFEVFAHIRAAIAREKEIKAWRREKKVWLIHRHNRAWDDLSEQFVGSQEHNQRAKDRKQERADPSPPSPKGGAGFGMTT